MNDLHWTPEKPTQPGLYNYCTRNGLYGIIRLLEGGRVQSFDMEPVKLTGHYSWYGPIPEYIEEGVGS